MGCCCSSARAKVDRAPAYYHYPRSSEPHEATSSAVSPGLVFDGHLNSSVPPDVHGAPPALVPYDNCGMKIGHLQPTDSNLKGSESKKSKVPGEQECLQGMEDEISKPSKSDASITEEEDVCPTCLEEYDLENPRIVTKCEHHFHLACIYEWMERSDTCPICNQVMMFDMV